MENEIYTEKRQFFALNLLKMPIFRGKSVKIYTGQKNLHENSHGFRDKYEVWRILM